MSAGRGGVGVTGEFKGGCGVQSVLCKFLPRYDKWCFGGAMAQLLSRMLCSFLLPLLFLGFMSCWSVKLCISMALPPLGFDVL